MTDFIYKITDETTWRAAQAAGEFIGSELDIADGFIHLSTAQTVKETAALYYAGVDHLLLVAVDATKADAELKWEASRNGQLFPHLFGVLPMKACVWAEPMPLGDDGTHVFPAKFSHA